jgi:cell division protein FtsB
VARSTASDRHRALITRAVVVLVVAAVAVFAVEGGEFSTGDLVRQRREKAQLVRAIDSLHRVDDSLAAYEAKVEHDPATQERIAREVFGMVRDKELLYRFTDTDTVR